MRADHHLPKILASCPEFGEPLALLIRAVDRRPVRLIDVGANIGDTVALLEAASPGKCRFLCIEGDDEFAELCRANTATNPRVTVEEYLIADAQGLSGYTDHHRPGTALTRLHANPGAVSFSGSIRCRTAGKMTRRLEDVAMDFVRVHGGLDVIKVDTDGFDFKVLRGAASLLQQYSPFLFFEWHPGLWGGAGEDPLNAFDFLGRLGYEHFAFFTNRGAVHAEIDAPSGVFLSTLVELCRARQQIDDLHFDVLTGEPATCRRVVEASLARLAGRRLWVDGRAQGQQV